MRGICNCVLGPPVNGFIETQVVPMTPVVFWPQFYPKQLTEEDIRRIVREELERKMTDKPA